MPSNTIPHVRVETAGNEKFYHCESVLIRLQHWIGQELKEDEYLSSGSVCILLIHVLRRLLMD